MSEIRAVPRVYLVGAGPGDPELLTVKALRLLQRADVVLHDALVSEAILALAPQARLVNVGRRSGRPSMAQRFIDRLLVSSARRHACVVRLKGGDPTLFGRLDEEMQALRAAGVAFEVVPGVTAATAAAAAVGTSLTLRNVARSVRFVTPRVAAEAQPDPARIGGAPDSDTLAVYMAGEMVESLAERLIANGHTDCTPLIIVENASLPTQSVWRGTLGAASDWPGACASGPVVLLVGRAVGIGAAAEPAAARYPDRRAAAA